MIHNQSGLSDFSLRSCMWSSLGRERRASLFCGTFCGMLTGVGSGSCWKRRICGERATDYL